MIHKLIFNAEATVGFNQQYYTVQENDKAVQVCADLFHGKLGINVSLYVDLDHSLNNSGIDLVFICLVCLVCMVVVTSQ